MPLETGTILKHRYRIEGVLGQGGMGAVYQAFDINLGVSVAVKENLFTTEEYARQFRREATILASLRHANLPRVTDHFVIEGEGQYLVMDFIQGEDLREQLERDGPLGEDEVLPWFLQICDALAYLHNRKPLILHRDIKPGNIKIMPDGRAILVDFGLAKVVEKGGATTTGAKAMTPGFSPPEQYGTGRTDPRTDVYSLGATLYATLTAAIPEDALERAMGREELTSPRKRNPDLSMGITRVIMKALSVRPEDRYQSVTELADALRSLDSTHEPVTNQQFPYLERSRAQTEQRAVSKINSRPYTPAVHRRRIPKLVLLLSTAVLFAAGAAVISPDFRGRIFGFASPSPDETLLPNAENETAIAGAAPTLTTAPISSVPSATVQDAAQATQSPAETAPALVTLIPTATPTGGGVGQIAFASTLTGKPQIYLINLDGTGLIQLTNLPEGACQPAWSPDGLNMVFTSPCIRNVESYPGSSLWLMEVDEAGNASEPTRLPSVPGGDYDPVWDPSGDRIAFTSLRDGRPQIFVINIDGTDATNLSGNLAYDRQPAWAPNGTQLVFTTSRGGVTEIWVMPDVGTGEQRFSRSSGAEDNNADWSSDGFVVFERNEGRFSRLYFTSFEERGVRSDPVCPVERSAQPMAEPAWSADGNWIAFEAWQDGTNHNIAIITRGCTNYTELTSDPAWDFDAAWRPVR
ncbi:MAG: serine/threonine-protein kinase [Anaerolineales bacterium]|nr:serine/threonine-protein kinase [Anaerolineales bacterium]